MPQIHKMMKIFFVTLGIIFVGQYVVNAQVTQWRLSETVPNGVDVPYEHSDYVLVGRKIKERFEKWLQQQSAEKTLDYELRLKNDSREAFSLICLGEIDNRTSQVRARLGSYEADGEYFPIAFYNHYEGLARASVWGQGQVAVPKTEAESFRRRFESAMTHSREREVTANWSNKDNIFVASKIVLTLYERGQYINERKNGVKYVIDIPIANKRSITYSTGELGIHHPKISSIRFDYNRYQEEAGELIRNSVYDYEIEKEESFKSLKLDLISEIKNRLKGVSGDIKGELVFDFLVNPNGDTEFTYGLPNSMSKDVVRDIVEIGRNKAIDQVYKDGIAVSAKAKFIIPIDLSTREVAVKKLGKSISFQNDVVPEYVTEISDMLSSKPIGDYNISVRGIALDENKMFHPKIMSFRSTGGPENALKSLLVPGWGMTHVTGGVQSGISTTNRVYGLIGLGGILKYYSYQEYKKYKKAVNQSDMDNFYKKANNANKGFMVAVGLASAIWIYDVIWVADKGFKNRKEADRFMKNFNVQYDPDINTSLLSYTINF